MPTSSGQWSLYSAGRAGRHGLVEPVRGRCQATGGSSGGIVCGVEGWQLPGMPRVPGVSELVSQLQTQTEALAQLPLTVAALNTAVQSLIEAVTTTRETAASAQRVSERLEEVIEELDAPVRALRPGLERVAKVLNDPVIDTVPETLRKLTEDVVPLVHGLRDAQTRVGLVFSQAATASARLAELPGAQLFRRRGRREEDGGAGAAVGGAGGIDGPQPDDGGRDHSAEPAGRGAAAPSERADPTGGPSDVGRDAAASAGEVGVDGATSATVDPAAIAEINVARDDERPR